MHNDHTSQGQDKQVRNRTWEVAYFAHTPTRSVREVNWSTRKEKWNNHKSKEARDRTMQEWREWNTRLDMQNLEPFGYTATGRWYTESSNLDIAIQSAASPPPPSICARPAASSSARFAFRLPILRPISELNDSVLQTRIYRISETFGGSVHPSQATPYPSLVLSKCKTWYVQTPRFLYISVVQFWCCGDTTLFSVYAWQARRGQFCTLR